MRFDAPQHDDETAPTHRHLLTDMSDIKRFLYAGNATLTIVSKKTGTRFTFRIKAAPEQEGRPNVVSHFVALMSGPNNEQDFQYLGHIYKTSQDYKHGVKSHIGAAAPSATAFEWFYNMLHFANALSPQLEVWHEGRCGRCHRKLTVPSSIATGIGPECQKILGIANTNMQSVA